MEMYKDGKDNTAFVTHLGLIRYLQMPLGLKIASATFHWAMKAIIVTVK